MWLIFFITTACTTQRLNWNPENYTAKSGDTLYSIAWRYEVDPEKLAAWNQIKTNQRVKAGHRLHIKKPVGFQNNNSSYQQTKTNNTSQQVVVKPLVTDDDKYQTKALAQPNQNGHINALGQKWIRVKLGDTLYALSKQNNISVQQLAQFNQLTKPYLIYPEQTLFLSAKKPTSNSVKSTTKSTPKLAIKKQKTVTHNSATKWQGKIKWMRPVNGKVIKKFKHNKNNAKGIDIAGKQGEAVLAAATGRVVYSGNGLISYGNLIIIKHNKTFLSAYAYNQTLLVKEGQKVKIGHKIATIGKKDKLSPRLHFEIRKNGKPINPLIYLP